MYHLIGSLHPSPGEKPKFSQIIVHDGDHDKEKMLLSQLERRMEVCTGKEAGLAKYNFLKSKAAIEINRETMDRLQRMLHDVNSYYATYMALSKINPAEIADKQIVLKADSRPPNNEHSRKWNLPENNEVAIIDIDPEATNSADVIIRFHDGSVQHINETHRSFEPMHYTLLFPRGDDG